MSAADDDILVAGLCGSLRPGSYSRAALALALDGAREVGARTRLIDPRDYELAFCDGNREDSDYPPDVERLRRDVAEADGLIWCTPEYHGGYSGVLKNMLDLMGFDGEVGRRVARFTYLHGSAEAREFLEAWESAPDNPGGDGQ